MREDIAARMLVDTQRPQIIKLEKASSKHLQEAVDRLERDHRALFEVAFLHRRRKKDTGVVSVERRSIVVGEKYFGVVEGFGHQREFVAVPDVILIAKGDKVP